MFKRRSSFIEEWWKKTHLTGIQQEPTHLKFNALQNRRYFIKWYYQSALGHNIKFLQKTTVIATYIVDKNLSLVIYKYYRIGYVPCTTVHMNIWNRYLHQLLSLLHVRIGSMQYNPFIMFSRITKYPHNVFLQNNVHIMNWKAQNNVIKIH